MTTKRALTHGKRDRALKGHLRGFKRKIKAYRYLQSTEGYANGTETRENEV